VNIMALNRTGAKRQLSMIELVPEALDVAALFAAVLCWGVLQAGAGAREAVWRLLRVEGC
jgi:hypothetical protein